MGAENANEAVVFPEDLSQLSADELTALQTRALAEFDSLADGDEIGDDGVQRLEVLATGIEGITAAIQAQQTAAAARTTALASTRERVGKIKRPQPPTSVKDDGDGDGGAAETDDSTDGGDDGGENVVAAGGARTRPRTSLAVAQANAPVIPDSPDDGLAIVAATQSPSMQMGQRFDTMDALVAATQSLARGAAITDGRPGFQAVARIENRFGHVLDDRTSLNEVTRIFDELRNQDAVEALVAGGGWCAPSETRYDFFNITCQDGMVDLPTVGITRGGITYPVSPSLADVFTGTFTNATNPWLWTEADDILTVTGTPNKPCVRVTCPTFDERRLECYGICLTAGNLTDYAYPEATRNHLSLLMAAHYHAMNQRYLLTMVSLSTEAIAFPTGSCGSIAADLPDRVAIAAQDYRTRYGMCDDDVLEVIIPRWARDAIRSDLTRRGGDAAYMTMSDADIDRLFTARRVRVQWVADWQVRASGYPGFSSNMTAWPTSLDFMIYAAGTFVRGNGLTLDLGIVRDSTLNAENDHTAAWTEECHLIARYGHESRLYRTPVCVGGLVGAGCTDCHVA